MSSIARPTFGVRKEPLAAGDYVIKKRRTKNNCVKNCLPHVIRNNNYNTNNLNSNLVTVLDLSGVCVISNNSTQQCSTPLIYEDLSNFYMNYEIDPKGELFGNTSCGLSNYRAFLKPYLPTYPLT